MNKFSAALLARYPVAPGCGTLTLDPRHGDGTDTRGDRGKIAELKAASRYICDCTFEGCNAWHNQGGRDRRQLVLMNTSWWCAPPVTGVGMVGMGVQFADSNVIGVEA